MKAFDLIDSVKIMFAARQPLYIWGPPGVGKSQVVKQAADELGVGLVDIRAVLLDPVDLRGLPRIDEDCKTSWTVPDFLPQEGKGILFLDELNSAPVLVQAACYQLILDRKLGDYVLPEGWFVVAAGNRETDRAVTNRISSALANRFTHIEFEVNIEDFVKWAILSGIRKEVISFLRFRPMLLHDFDPSRNEKAFPTPRSWEFVSGILNRNPPEKLLFELLKGTIGEGAASEFFGYLRVFKNVPDVNHLIKNKLTWIPPHDDPGLLYAVSQAAASKADAFKIEDIMNFAGCMPKEFEILTMRDSVKKNRGIVETEFFSNWAKENSELFF
ncbi:MAG: ATP-binding protein [Desulfobacteraceae bacterium]